MATNELNALMTNPELLGLERQRKMAQALLQQGMTMPQGQMIGNRYVPTNPMQYIGNLFNVYAGQKGLEEADKQELALAEALRKQDLADLQAGMQLYQGTPEKTIELAGPYGQGVGAEGANVPMPTAYTPAQAANPQAAMAYLLGSKGPKSSAVGADLYKQMFAAPEWKPEKRYENGMEINGWVNVKAPNPAATFVASSKRPDLELYKAVDEGYLPQGGGAAVTPYTQPGQAPVSVRNNNPGNLVGADGQFLKFATPQEGEAALIKDLALKLSGQSPAYKARFGNAPVTPTTLAETWSPANAKGNSPESTANYSKFIASKLGIAPNQPIPNTPEALNIVKSAISQFEAGAYSGQTAQTGDAKYMPANLPQYEYDPSLTPKQNREAAAKFSQENQGAIKNAKNAFGILKTAADILNTNAPSSGRAENIITGTREFFGGGGETSKADAQLKILGNKLTMQVPRFEGPQSDKDTAVYQAAAGDLQNPNIPISTRLAAVQQMIELNKKYYPNGDWDSIDVGGPVVKSQTFLRGEQKLDPIKFREGLNDTDKQAFDWARKNPTDPRSAQIKKTLGIE